MCAEDHWINHPMGTLFRTAKDDPYAVEILLKKTSISRESTLWTEMVEVCCIMLLSTAT